MDSSSVLPNVVHWAMKLLPKRRAWANRVFELGPPAGHITITVETVATNGGVVERKVGLSSHLTNQFE